ncbi:MAG: SDR family NAD(P)-dependent oxidoreductase, partial [Chloroflexi bacterium]|nr:SDR family NAD(P)-dependent oxidoreductase [Chloroflexota bacterium]
MDLRLEGKRAIVTGGSRGIGKTVARMLAAEGVDVALVARSAGPLEEAAAEIASETGRRVIGVPADTGDNTSVRAMVARVVSELGGVDILVNSAAQAGGQGPVPRFDEVDADQHFWPDMNVKVMGYLRCAQAVAPHMKAAGWGRIINISGL